MMSSPETIGRLMPCRVFLERLHSPHHHANRLGFSRQMAKVSAVANETHTRYGKSNAAATVLIRLNCWMVAMIRTNSSSISAKARPPRRQTKNNQVQRALMPSWARNMTKAGRAPENPRSRQTNHADTPISAYSTDHTGPNSQPGGAPHRSDKFGIKGAGLG